LRANLGLQEYGLGTTAKSIAPAACLLALLAVLGGGCTCPERVEPLRLEDYNRSDFPVMASRIAYVPRMDAHKLKLRNGAALLGSLVELRSHVEWSEETDPDAFSRTDWRFSPIGFDHIAYFVYPTEPTLRSHFEELRQVVVEDAPEAVFMSSGAFDIEDPYIRAFGGYGPKHWGAFCTLLFQVADEEVVADEEERIWDARVSVSLAVFFTIEGDDDSTGPDEVEVVYHVVVFSEECTNTLLVFSPESSARIITLCAKIGLIQAEGD
jgi:hypothetical protein